MAIDDKLLDAVVKGVGLLGGAFAWLYQTRSMSLRNKIKADLEILEKTRTVFGEKDQRSEKVAAKVSGLMSYLYQSQEHARGRGVRGGDLAIAVFFFALAVLWLWYTSRHSDTFGPIWQTLGAGGLAFVALGGFLNAFERNAASTTIVPPAA